MPLSFFNRVFQIFINLGTIKNATDNIVDIALNECIECLKSAVDTNSNNTTFKKPGGPGRVNMVSSQGFRSRIWDDLEKAFTEELYCQAKQVSFYE